MIFTDLLDRLKRGVTDPHTLTLVLQLVTGLSDGDLRLPAETRLELQAELDKLTGGLL